MISEAMGTRNGLEALRSFRELLSRMETQCQEKAAKLKESTSDDANVSEDDGPKDEGQGKLDGNAGDGARKRAPSKSPPKPSSKVLKSIEQSLPNSSSVMENENTSHSNGKSQEAIEFPLMQRAPAFGAKEYLARKEEQTLDPGFHFPNLIERFQSL